MFDQYNQALIAASYGQLSLSADVAVLPETYIPYSLPEAQDNFTYYEQPAKQARLLRGWEEGSNHVSLEPIAGPTHPTRRSHPRHPSCCCCRC